MDNASIHSVLMEKLQCAKTREADIMAWLSGKNIPRTDSQTRTELLQLVKMNKPLKCYELDTTAMQRGLTGEIAAIPLPTGRRKHLQNC
jgi:hypothetical protein